MQPGLAPQPGAPTRGAMQHPMQPGDPQKRGKIYARDTLEHPAKGLRSSAHPVHPGPALHQKSQPGTVVRQDHHEHRFRFTVRPELVEGQIAQCDTFCARPLLELVARSLSAT